MNLEGCLRNWTLKNGPNHCRCVVSKMYKYLKKLEGTQQNRKLNKEAGSRAKTQSDAMQDSNALTVA